MSKITRISDLSPDVRYEFVSATGRRVPAEVHGVGVVTIDVPASYPGGSEAEVTLYQGDLDLHGGHFEVVKPRREWTVGKTITINGITHPVEAVNLATTASQVAALFGGTIQDRPEWHDALPGEVWEVTRKFGTTEDTVWMVVNPFGRFEDYTYEIDETDGCIVHAEQVYPHLFRNPNGESGGR